MKVLTNPPSHFKRLLCLACMTMFVFTCGETKAQVQAYLDYDAALGTLAVDTVSPTNGITTFELNSLNQFLVGVDPPILKGNFDIYVPDKIFRLDPRGFFDIDFGPILTPDLAPQQLASNLCINGSVIEGGALDAVELRSGGATFPVPRHCEFDPNFNPITIPGSGPESQPKPESGASSAWSAVLLGL